VTAANELESAVDRVGSLLDAKIGLRPQSTLRGRLRRCIRDEIQVRDQDLDSYIEVLTNSKATLQSLVNRVTVQESGFFRHPDHFQVLADDVLPMIGRPVNIWSAGCANGQEAYSLAMLLQEQGVLGSILASDLSTNALARTAAARYTTREIAGLSPLRRLTHLTQDDNAWRVNHSLRDRVSTMRHNLMEELPDRVGECQVVFCRNVLIYFSADHATAFLNRLAGVLSPGAYLFLGSAESLWQVSDAFQAVRLGESFVYQRNDPARPRMAVQELATRTARPQPPTRRPPAPKATRTPTPVPVPVPKVVALEPDLASPPALAAASGQTAFADGDHGAAVVAFRKWVYLSPEDPLAALHLGLALEACGHWTSAQRAFSVSRALLQQVGPEHTEVALEGYAAGELLRLLETKQGPN
jgi:chemotaxis methyl-accepting protein methylase